MEGSPIRPSHTRFAEVIARHRITILKAGSTFLREIMSYPKVVNSLRGDFNFSSVRVATFCAEPLAPQVQAFAMQHICPQYINSYWSTEHGGITWSHVQGNQDQLLIANTHTWPLPWIFADVLHLDRIDNGTGGVGKSVATTVAAALPGENGGVAITRPFPYMMRCLWGDTENVLDPSWKGDAETTINRYWHRVRVSSGDPQWVFVQRDFAQRHHGGAYTFHGRSDEVMNLCGMMIGTETIESAILRDKHLNPSDSPVGDCAVVGHPHTVYGEMPLAFITPPAAGVRLKERDITRLSSLVFEAVGNVGIQFVQVPELPRTQTGKIMRALLRGLIKDDRVAFLESTKAMQNPGCLRHLQTRLRDWRELHSHFTDDIGGANGVQQVTSSTDIFGAAGADESSGVGSQPSSPRNSSKALSGWDVSPAEGRLMASAGQRSSPLPVRTARKAADAKRRGASAVAPVESLMEEGAPAAATEASQPAAPRPPAADAADPWKISLDVRHLAGATVLLAVTVAVLTRAARPGKVAGA
eukprot:gnl/TRDRNA2_/TRDRNA2_157788_c1_seq1.p1 gnl/TRDRNA2_/TRDRNA2_157788_c1~~gnl/TRDRNA2_/TRDRNA2_157788_c1_seq1.p1  ORF type:complete len:559 (-),score=80.72 gnl/TRDRNA2_/TRDRNA2_157788_c1_seq1:110-1693(-)